MKKICSIFTLALCLVCTAAETPDASTFDIDKIASNPWLIACFFLLVQWFEIWYFNRTGKKSETLDKAEAAMEPKLGTVQKLIYKVFRWHYFRRNPNAKDPDAEDKQEAEAEEKK